MDSKRQRAEKLIDEGEALEDPAITNPSMERRASDKARRAAIEKFSEAIELCPECSRAFVNRSSAYYFLGRSDLARADALKAVALNHPDAMDYYFLSVGFSGEPRREILRAGLRLTGDQSFAHYQLAEAIAQSYFYEGDFESHVKTFEEIIEHTKTSTDPTIATTRMQAAVWRGMGLEALGRYAEAEADYRVALAFKDPLSPPNDHSLEAMVARDIVRSYLRREDPEGASKALVELAGSISSEEARAIHVVIGFMTGAPPFPPAELRKMLRPDDGMTSYSNFVVGIGLFHAGLDKEARPLLKGFISRCESNPREWGVTLRWEIALAKSVLAGTKPPGTSAH